VQGNDRRLKDATTLSKGIVELAENGEDKPNVAVQGNDRRLKDATTLSKGIVELAEDGEDKPNVAVQGNDRRLKDATTLSKGIVELAEDGENAPNVAVQGNDKRLKHADESAPGIVRFAKANEQKKGFAVQANDPRLYDRREPLDHSHEYAHINHDFNSHSGTLSISNSASEIIKEITPPSSLSSIIHAVNESSESGAIGVCGTAGLSSKEDNKSYGVFGHSRHIGVRGQSSGGDKEKGCGVLGLSRFGAGGIFASEHDYSLVVDGFGVLDKYDASVRLHGNGEAMLVSGNSVFDGLVSVRNTRAGEHQVFPMSIAEIFEVDEAEYISPGDLLVVSESGGSILSRSRNEYSRSVIGVVAGNPVIIIDNSGVEKKAYPISLSGKAFCKVDARRDAVMPGDFIVTSGTPGCGMKGIVDSFDRIGTVIGKALDRLDDGIGLVPIFILHC
jgi:hypothetical protein